MGIANRGDDDPSAVQADHVAEAVAGGADDERTRRRRARERRLQLYAAQILEWLRAQLAPNGRCQRCGKLPRVHSLQIHHVDGRDWEPREHNQWTRAVRYRREYLAGARMAAWCIQCNSGTKPDGAAKTAKNRLNKASRARKNRERMMAA